MIKRKKCKNENCNNFVWAKGYCKYHYIKDNKKDNTPDIEKMNEFFLSIWKKRLHYSEISGVYLGKEILNIYFHHILPKEKYTEFKYYDGNIILVTGDEHHNLHTNIYKYEKVNKLREKLLNEYYNLKSINDVTN